MKKLQTIIFVCTFFLAATSHAQNFGDRGVINKNPKNADAPTIDAPFDRVQGNAWALVVTGDELDPLYIQQMALLMPHAETLKSRQMVVIHFHGRTLKLFPELSVGEFQLPSLRGKKSGEKGESSHKKIERLERQLRTDDDVFSVVLVGIDGATKFVWTLAPVSPAVIYQVMDNPELMPLTP